MSLSLLWLLKEFEIIFNSVVEKLFYFYQEKNINIELGLLINRLHIKKLAGAYNEQMLLFSYKPAFLKVQILNK